MRVLLDHCVDIHFRDLLPGHEVRHTKEMGGQSLSNGKLLAAAEEAGFMVMITVDKSVRFQQKMSKKAISLITLSPLLIDLRFLEPMVPELLATLNEGFPPGSDIVITA